MSSRTLKQIAELNTLSIPQLEERWRKLFGTAPPAHQRRFMVKRLAYRSQARGRAAPWTGAGELDSGRRYCCCLMRRCSSSRRRMGLMGTK